MENDATLLAFLEDDACYLLLAVHEHRVVGSLNGYRLRHPHTRSPQFLIYEIDVREGERNRGVGKALIFAFVDIAKVNDAWEMWVVTNKSNRPAMKMYARCGFTPGNDDDQTMARLIDTGAWIPEQFRP